MKLSALIGEAFPSDPDITGITSDSRAVRKGFLFVALPGEKVDGAEFIPQAEKNGAAAILGAHGVTTSLPLVADENPRARLAAIAARFYPQQPEIVAGITGTNGKTSTAHFAAQLWAKLGRNGGSLGTLGAEAKGFKRRATLTTPEPVALHETLNAMASAGVNRLAMEVSSHAIAQSRADAVKFSIAAFTNITQDHLDYHPTFADYFAAKARLFEELLPADGVAVVNVNGDGAGEIVDIAKARGAKIYTTGAEGDAICLLKTEATPSGTTCRIAAFGEEYQIELPLIGAFQAENALLAAGIVIASGEPSATVMPLLGELAGVPGRMQLATTYNNAGVYVDYAHTPDAVASALSSIRPHAEGRIIAVVGAGGDRDKAKRPLMGKAAQDGAEFVIVTDDNPRSEDPAAIRKGVLSGCAGAIEIGDRGEAIARGVSLLKDGDVLLVLGKGHETGQHVRGNVLPFDDVEAALAAADALQQGRKFGS